MGLLEQAYSKLPPAGRTIHFTRRLRHQQQVEASEPARCPPPLLFQGHSVYTSVRGASSMTSGTDGRPNCSMRSGDGGAAISSSMVRATGADRAGCATACRLTHETHGTGIGTR
jgi:hypothetical protein